MNPTLFYLASIYIIYAERRQVIDPTTTNKLSWGSSETVARLPVGNKRSGTSIHLPLNMLDWVIIHATHVAQIFIINRSYLYSPGAKLTLLLTSHTLLILRRRKITWTDTLNNAICGCPHLDIMSSSYPPVSLKF